MKNDAFNGIGTIQHTKYQAMVDIFTTACAT